MANKPSIQRNQNYTLNITALGSEGQGIGHIDGYTVFVPGAIPPERVEVCIIKPGKGYGVAKLQRIISPSAARVVPFCPVYGRCGGCNLQHMAYSAQLAFKRQMVQDAFFRIGGLQVPVQPVLGMEQPWAYRNKGSFPLTMVEGKVAFGFFAPRSHRLIPLENCDIQHPAVLQAARAVREWANVYAIPAYDEETGDGLLRHLVARVTTTGEVMVTLVAKDVPPAHKPLLDMLQTQVEGLRSVYFNIHTSKTNVILGDDYRLLWGAERILERLLGLDFSIKPASFLQINSSQTARLYQAGLDMLKLDGSEHVVDAYCGIGTISLVMAQKSKEVVGIEYVRDAVEDARHNAAQNNIANARFLCGEAERLLPVLLKEGFSTDVVVLDPPRKGADEVFLRSIIKSDAERVLYISCDPGTLARDCKLLVSGGYAVQQVQPVDMFGQMSHVETIVLLQRKDS